MWQCIKSAIAFERVNNLLLISRHEAVPWEDSLSNLWVIHLSEKKQKCVAPFSFMSPPQTGGSVDHFLHPSVLWPCSQVDLSWQTSWCQHPAQIFVRICSGYYIESIQQSNLISCHLFLRRGLDRSICSFLSCSPGKVALVLLALNIDMLIMLSHHHYNS